MTGEVRSLLTAHIWSGLVREYFIIYTRLLHAHVRTQKLDDTVAAARVNQLRTLPLTFT